MLQQLDSYDGDLGIQIWAEADLRVTSGYTIKSVADDRWDVDYSVVYQNIQKKKMYVFWYA